MANNIEKITSIEEQIEKLKEKRKNLEKQMQQNIGAELLKEWNVESEEEAIKWIQKLAVQVNEKKEQPEAWDVHEAENR
ncbi:hypothetical protein [Planococcus halocryophilus]|uniref:hypothetical protein n=1 Tax=Planococcus halocryophilus TaxID=1215089 RepID=UPI001F0FCA07|nr:hypothetical protein [Planococcus halocryophilus]MCH4827543.1 hypothetical protein [Planococcus halocryophilus]